MDKPLQRLEPYGNGREQIDPRVKETVRDANTKFRSGTVSHRFQLDSIERSNKPDKPLRLTFNTDMMKDVRDFSSSEDFHKVEDSPSMRNQVDLHDPRNRKVALDLSQEQFNAIMDVAEDAKPDPLNHRNRLDKLSFMDPNGTPFSTESTFPVAPEFKAKLLNSDSPVPNLATIQPSRSYLNFQRNKAAEELGYHSHNHELRNVRAESLTVVKTNDKSNPYRFEAAFTESDPHDAKHPFGGNYVTTLRDKSQAGDIKHTQMMTKTSAEKLMQLNGEKFPNPYELDAAVKNHTKLNQHPLELNAPLKVVHNVRLVDIAKAEGVFAKNHDINNPYTSPVANPDIQTARGVKSDVNHQAGRGNEKLFDSLHDRKPDRAGTTKHQFRRPKKQNSRSANADLQQQLDDLSKLSNANNSEQPKRGQDLDF